MRRNLLIGLLVLLSLWISSSIHADCTKDEIIKLINAGYTKTDISSLCGNNDGASDKPKSAPGDTWKDPFSGIEFIFIKGGCYNMGSNSGDRDERPVHEVCLDDFWMGKYEVTQEQWAKLMERNLSSNRGKKNFPIDNMSWFEAQQYVTLLSEQAGVNFSLPTEAQWEYAARNRGQNVEMLGKNDLNRIAWYRDNCGGPRRIGSKASNELGLYDMIGNVAEWCEDIYVENGYSRHIKNNPVNSTGGTAYVKRGGGYGSTTEALRPSNRDRLEPAFRRSDLGFRISFWDRDK